MKKRTNNDFVVLVKELVGDEFVFLDEYINATTKIRVQHNKCGRIFYIAPYSFINNGNRCSDCSGKSKKNTEIFKKEISEIVGDEYTLIGEYFSSNKKTMMVHNICNKVWAVTPNNFLSGTRCSNCFGKHKKNTKQISIEVSQLTKNEYEVIGEYINSQTKIQFKHKVCNNNFDMVPSIFLWGTRCPHCFGTPKKSTEIFRQEVLDLVGAEYSVNGEYTSNREKISAIHNKCSHEYKVTPSMFLAGKRCPKCAGNLKWSNEKFVSKVKNLVGDEYIFSEVYIDSGHPLEVVHRDCARIFKTRPRDFLRGSRCPYCHLDSKGELEIEKLLNNSRLTFKRQHRFNRCRDKNPLPFDFTIYNQSNNIICIIEYDGRQHFEAIEHWGGEKSLKLQQKRDKIKNEYCKENNIPLLRIPYWEYKNIKKILTKRLTELGVLPL